MPPHIASVDLPLRTSLRSWKIAAVSGFSLAIALASPAQAADASAMAETASESTVKAPSVADDDQRRGIGARNDPDDPDSDDDIEQPEPRTGLNTITVTATRNESTAFDYPGSVSVVDRDIIDDFNPSSLAEIFQAIPGARFDGGPRRSGSVPTVRGLGGDGVLIFIDGARQSFTSGHDGRLFLDPELLQAVEVVRGPTSALYGSGALGGVISLRTITAQDYLGEGEQVGGRVVAGYQGVNDEWRWGGTAAMQSSDGEFDFVGNVTFRNSSDIELGSGLTLPDRSDSFNSLAKFTWRPSDSLTLSTQWVHNSSDTLDPNNPQGNNVGGPGNLNVNRSIRSNTLQTSLNFNPVSDLVNADVIFFYANNRVGEQEVGTSRRISREVETYGITLVNRSEFALGDNASLRFTYGGEYYQDEQTGTDNTTADGTRGGVPDATRRFYGAFVQAELGIETGIGEFNIIPGIRFDRFENEAVGEQDVNDDAFAPKVGVSWKPVPELILFANWAEAFRAPSYNEIFADGVHFQIPNLGGPPGPPQFVSNLFVPNRDLQPEESETIEFGAGVDFSNVIWGNDRFTLKGSYYESDVDNLIGLDVDIPAGCFGAPFPPCGSGAPFGNISRNVNFAQAEVSGFEIEGSYDSDYFYVRANFATIDGVDRATGEFVGVLTPDLLFVDTGFKFAPFDLRVGARLTVAGDFTEVDDPLQFRDGYETADVYAIWQPLSGALEGFRLDLGIDNVTDNDFEVVAAGVSQPGRNYKATLSWRGAF
ncbi:TonB-dependent receptor domain-containing protein [Alterisphingorhabdus coralli]|uniref:TonB-dependent receptor n=1 Tax=Alterisphingorhabdus coralli TaxID=3071408 RepID=A0AA97I269_9SPHN|nr:TonB-dependent receptor [Parasphingorhabdus sp. SCSIO 66989]WOE75933.1 TonB-dependent receptor [Parasphingorhabdus sp. SCSIO 66989]